MSLSSGIDFGDAIAGKMVGSFKDIMGNGCRFLGKAVAFKA
uniref:Uncharacterized protein n=1 Tax=Desertifilum tharense IPPAS B-1220 TaxID=1781255 RepID=A0ACD5GRF0_9CYAN